MKLTNSSGRVKGSRSSMDNDQAEKSKSTRDKTKKIAATTAEAGNNNNGNKNNDKRSKAKGWRKALNDGDTTEDAESSALSDLSDSTEDGYDDDGAAKSIAGERSEDYELFEKALRSKHSKACKAMSVRYFNVSHIFALFMNPLLLTQFISFAPVEWCLPQSISRL